MARTKKKILEYAAYAESSSSHPVGKSILEAYGKDIDRSRIFGVEEKPGRGIVANVDNKAYIVGNGKFMKEYGIEYSKYGGSETVVYVASDKEYKGAILISDKIKNNSKRAVEELKKTGIKKTVMLTGDVEKTAIRVAKTLKIDTVFSELLPAGKIEKLEEIIKEGQPVAFVGDGINDAPALARADIGIAMGAMGSDAAIEAADLVLMDDDPMKISNAIRHSKKVLGIVKQNIVFSLFVKFACLALVSIGIGNMWFGIFADVGVMVVAVVNAVRALKLNIN